MNNDNNPIEEDKKEEKTSNNIINENQIKKSSIPIDVKKPIMTQEEYQKMMEKRNLMKKKSKYRPMTLLFGKHSRVPHYNNNFITNYNSVSFTSPNVPNINNTNIQINNYNTYLTSIETIVEEKYQKDDQILTMENPSYSMKQLNYKYKTNQLNQIMIIYIRKINELEDIYNFTNEYLSFIIKIFEKLCQPFINSLSEIFVKNIMPNLKYFQETMIIFNNFSEKIKGLEKNSFENKENNGNNNKLKELNYFNRNLNESVKKINNVYADTFNNTSKQIYNLIMNNPLFIKIDTIESKYTDVYNKMNVYINKLIHRQKKFNDKYMKDILIYFSNIKQRLNDPTFFQFLITGKDFLFIEKEVLFHVNKIYNKISQFLVNMEFLFQDSQNTFYGYLELLNNLIKIFYNENNTILNVKTLLPNKSLLNLDVLLKTKDIREKIIEKFSFKNIIENNENENIFNFINRSLLNYRDLLLQNNFVKNEDIEEVLNFNLITYHSSNNFIQFLLKLVPPKFPFKFRDIIELKMNIKRNSGIIKGWRNSLLVITYQGHLLIFDQDGEPAGDLSRGSDGNKNWKKMSRKEIINSIIIDDDKNEHNKNENDDLYEAIKNNKSMIYYWRSNLKAVKLSSKDDKKLIQLYEDYMGYRQYRPTLIDLLNDNNLNIFINVISNNKFI